MDVAFSTAFLARISSSMEDKRDSSSISLFNFFHGNSKTGIQFLPVKHVPVGTSTASPKNTLSPSRFTARMENVMITLRTCSQSGIVTYNCELLPANTKRYDLTPKHKKKAPQGFIFLPDLFPTDIQEIFMTHEPVAAQQSRWKIEKLVLSHEKKSQ